VEKILISGCLLGAKVRYNGEGKLIENPLITQWSNEGRFVSICPEMAGGLPTPRPAAQIRDNKVVTEQGTDVTSEFNKGAKMALALCQKHNIKIALLKARSPSCGNEQIHDGSFSGKIISGQGITAALLTQHGVRVFNENQLDEAADVLNQIEEKKKS